MNLASDWSVLVGRILSPSHVGSAIPQKPDEVPSDEGEWSRLQYAPDLAFTPAGANEPTAVEIKMLRWRKNWLGRVSNTVVHMEQILARTTFKRGIIIFSFAIAPQWMVDLNEGASDGDPGFSKATRTRSPPTRNCSTRSRSLPPRPF
jgi:hypothetical protein